MLPILYKCAAVKERRQGSLPEEPVVPTGPGQVHLPAVGLQSVEVPRLEADDAHADDHAGVSVGSEVPPGPDPRRMFSYVLCNLESNLESNLRNLESNWPAHIRCGCGGAAMPVWISA